MRFCTASSQASGCHLPPPFLPARHGDLLDTSNTPSRRLLRTALPTPLVGMLLSPLTFLVCGRLGPLAGWLPPHLGLSSRYVTTISALVLGSASVCLPPLPLSHTVPAVMSSYLTTSWLASASSAALSPLDMPFSCSFLSPSFVRLDYSRSRKLALRMASGLIFAYPWTGLLSFSISLLPIPRRPLPSARTAPLTL